jgi:predicted RNA-binding Zn-ribbon protein involved in translation (DUF1610 family)
MKGIYMAMRTYRHFVCPQGHMGDEKTLESDQPYSKAWESVMLTGMKEFAKDAKGYTAYACHKCGQAMSLLVSN